MLGNLSKVLIKAPNFFNNMKTEEGKSRPLYNIPEEENVLDPFNSIKVVKTRGNSYKNIYFRERDFWKKNLLLDINYNHNKRLPPLFSSPSKIETLHKRNKNNINKSSSLENKNLSLTPKTEEITKYKIEQSKNRYLSENEPVKDLSNTLKNDINNIINKKNDTTFLKFKGKTIDVCESVDIENNKKVNVIVREKFPKYYSLIRSQESLFQDNVDRRLNSLRNIKPEIKEQLKEKNRYMVGKREFLAYKNLKRLNLKNPFFESIKMKENLNLKTLK